MKIYIFVFLAMLLASEAIPGHTVLAAVQEEEKQIHIAGGFLDFLFGAEDESTKQKRERQKQASINRKEGEAFLSRNKQREDVVTLPSGLQYRIIKEGTGPKPKATDIVVVNYRGTLIDETEFDSSYGKDPVPLSLQRVIKGWREALQLMPVGSTWEIFIPSELGYGASGSPPIGPDEVLLFQIELISIK